MEKHEKAIHQETNPLRVKCPICEKILSEKGHLKTHIKLVHERNKAHVCHMCGKGFGEPILLRRHINGIHERKKKFVCQKCSAGYTRKEYLEKHIKAKCKPPILRYQVKRLKGPDYSNVAACSTRLLSHLPDMRQDVEHL